MPTVASVADIPQLRSVADSASLSVPPALTGTVTRGDQLAPADRAVVYLQAWPSSDRLAEMKKGDSFDMRPVAKAVTDSDGRYSLRVDPEAVTPQLVSDQGLMDVEVVAIHGHDVSLTSVTVAADPTARPATRLALSVTGEGPPGEAEMVEPGSATTKDALRPVGHYNGTCPGGEGLKKKFKDRWVNVGSIHIAARKKHMKFTFTEGASSELGTAISTTGAFDSWSASGTFTQTTSTASTTTVNYPKYKKKKQLFLDTKYSYGKFCIEYSDSMHGVGHRYKVRSIKHEGGTRSRKTVKPKATHCVPYRINGSGAEQTESNAITWTNGAKLAGAIGIDLSSRTGFTTSNKLKFTFVKRGRLCGTHDKPTGSPRRLVMRRLG